MKQQVSIIILNWNGWKDTVECLESVYHLDYDNYNVVVVDNGFEDKSIEMIREYASGKLEIKSNFVDMDIKNKNLRLFEYTNVELKSLIDESKKFDDLESNNKLILIKNDNNDGFSVGNNIGIKFSIEILNPKYILLLNNDTVVDRNFLKEMISFADNKKKVGIVGPKVYYYDNPDQIAYIGHNVNLCTARISDPDLKFDKYDSTPLKIDFVVGCGLLIKTGVIEDIGLLDPDYFLYYEDVDWCLRAKNKSYDTFYIPTSILWHKIPLNQSRSLNSYYYGNRNSFLFVKKNNYSINILFCYIQLIINKSILSLYLLVKGNKKASFVVIQAVYDGIIGRYGYKKF